MKEVHPRKGERGEQMPAEPKAWRQTVGIATARKATGLAIPETRKPKTAGKHQHKGMAKPGETKGYGINDGLTEKQEGFCQMVATGRNLSDSYRAHYRTEGLAQATVWSAAFKLSRSPRVADRLAELFARKQRESLHSAAFLRAKVLEGLAREAETADTAAARVAALAWLGKTDIAQLFRDIREVDVTDTRTVEQLKDELKQRLTQLLTEAKPME